MDTPRLTAYSHGSGCGCKIAPDQLEKILQQLVPFTSPAQLLVGRSTKDDAAVYDLGNGKALISTVDCFTPIVDNPADFGMIAAANALSDVYAMGGTPIFALALLGWPIDKLPTDMAGEVLAGGQRMCEQAGIPLAGGHSIDTPEPLFGLVVNGVVELTQLITNAGAKAGDVLFLSKPLGTGIVAAAQKRGKVQPDHVDYTTRLMKTINTIGAEVAGWGGIHAMTDVTGFGLLGHLIEMCEASGLTAIVDYRALPKLPDAILRPYLEAFIVPDNTYRNYNSYKDAVTELTAEQLTLLCDPQTNGGLLMAVDPSAASTFSRELAKRGLPHEVLGRCIEKEGKTVKVR